MNQATEDAIIQFIPLMTLSLIWAWPIFLIAKKQGRNPWLWAILVIIPLVNVVTFSVFWVLTIMTILDRLNAMEKA